jgi:hypothetical protein
MPKYAGPNLKITYDSTDMTAFVQTINGVDVTQNMQDAKTFGEVWNAMIPSGAKELAEFVIGGLYDDVAAGPAAKWDVTSLTPTPNDAPKTLLIQLDSPAIAPGVSYSIPVHPSKFVNKFDRNGVHEYEATLVKGVGDVTKTAPVLLARDRGEKEDEGPRVTEPGAPVASNPGR